MGLTDSFLKCHAICYCYMKNRGMFEWTGDWSDDSSQWTPALLQEMNYALDVLDGTFWISFDDFLRYFVFFEVCLVRQPQHQRPWTEVRRRLWVSLVPPPLGYNGEEEGSSAPLLVTDTMDIPRRISCMFILQVTSPTPTVMYFSAHQPNKVRSESEGCLYFDIGVTVLRIEVDGTFTFACSSGLAVERQVQTSAVLEQGVYIVIPMTSGAKLKQYQQQRDQNTSSTDTNRRNSTSATYYDEDNLPNSQLGVRDGCDTSSFGSVPLLDETKENFSEAVDAVFDEIFDRFDTDNDGVTQYH